MDAGIQRTRALKFVTFLVFMPRLPLLQTMMDIMIVFRFAETGLTRMLSQCEYIIAGGNWCLKRILTSTIAVRVVKEPGTEVIRGM